MRVAAASDLSRAFAELGLLFEAKTRQKVEFSFGSTGLLAKQLRAGAPFDMFAAASESFVDEVVTDGACDGTTRAPYGHGRIVLWSKHGLVQPAATFDDLSDARFQRIAIAQPEHAPYGKAAQQALQTRGLWSSVTSRLVYGENVQQAYQFAQSGNAEVAIVALSLVTQAPGASNTRAVESGTYLLIDEALHEPLAQELVVCKHGKSREGGLRFAQFVNSEAGRVIMLRYGFALPSETLVRAP